jgi:hypothetical protein
MSWLTGIWAAAAGACLKLAVMTALWCVRFTCWRRLWIANPQSRRSPNLENDWR